MKANNSSVDESSLREEFGVEELKRLLPTILFLAVLSIIGILGNGCVFYVYRPKRNHPNSHLFILCLSVLDLFSSSVAIPIDVIVTIIFKEGWLCKFSKFLNVFGICSSCFILVFISIDRFRKVCRPFGWQISSNVAKCLSLVAICFGLSLAAPIFFVFGKVSIYIKQFNLTRNECDFVVKVSEAPYMMIYILVFGSLFTSGIIVISVLYCLIGFKLRKQSQKIRYITKPASSPNFHDLYTATCSTFDSQELTHNDRLDTRRKLERKLQSSKQKLQWQEWTEATEETSTDTASMNASHIEMVFKGKMQAIYLDNEGEEENTNENDSSFNVSETVCKQLGKCHVQSKSPTKKANTTNSVIPKSTKHEEKIEKATNITCNSQIHRNLNRSRDRIKTGQREKTNYLKQIRIRKTTLLMLFITIASFVSFVPHLGLVLVRNVVSNFVVNLSETERAFYIFFYKSFFLNCAVNPIMYNFCDSKFRYAMRNIFRRANK